MGWFKTTSSEGWGFFNHFVSALGHQEPWRLTAPRPWQITRHSRGHATTQPPDATTTESTSLQWSSTAPPASGAPLEAFVACFCRRPSSTSHRTPNDIKLDLRVNLVLQGSFSKVLEEVVAKRLPHVVVKLFPSCVFHYVQARWWWKRRGRRSAAAFGGQRTWIRQIGSCFVKQNLAHIVAVMTCFPSACKANSRSHFFRYGRAVVSPPPLGWCRVPPPSPLVGGAALDGLAFPSFHVCGAAFPSWMMLPSRSTFRMELLFPSSFGLVLHLSSSFAVVLPHRCGDDMFFLCRVKRKFGDVMNATLGSEFQFFWKITSCSNLQKTGWQDCFPQRFELLLAVNMFGGNCPSRFFSEGEYVFVATSGGLWISMICVWPGPF